MRKYHLTVVLIVLTWVVGKSQTTCTGAEMIEYKISRPYNNGSGNFTANLPTSLNHIPGAPPVCYIGGWDNTGKILEKITYYNPTGAFTGRISTNQINNQDNYEKLYPYFELNRLVTLFPSLAPPGNVLCRISAIAGGGGWAQGQFIYNDEDYATDMFSVVQGALSYRFTPFSMNDDGMTKGIKDFIAQMYKWELGFTTHTCFSDPDLFDHQRRTDYTECYNLSNNTDHNVQVWSTLLMKIYTFMKTHNNNDIETINKCIKITEMMHDNLPSTASQISAAEELYKVIKNGDYVNQNGLCAIRTIITDHYKCLNPSTLRPNLDDIADYYIADETSDNGTERNPSNTSEWESPAIINRQSNDGLFENQAAVVDVENTLYIEIANKGCDTVTDAVLQVYYALSQTGLTWDDAWVENVITVGSGTILAGDKIAEIAIPSITSQSIRIPITWTPPDIESLNVPNSKINVLARIVSAVDMMSEVEVKDVRTNVRNNNNVAWKVLNLIK